MGYKTGFEANTGNSVSPCLYIPSGEKAGNVVQCAQSSTEAGSAAQHYSACLPSMREALGPILFPPKDKATRTWNTLECKLELVDTH